MTLMSPVGNHVIVHCPHGLTPSLTGACRQDLPSPGDSKWRPFFNTPTKMLPKYLWYVAVKLECRNSYCPYPRATTIDSSAKIHQVTEGFMVHEAKSQSTCLSTSLQLAVNLKETLRQTSTPPPLHHMRPSCDPFWPNLVELLLAVWHRRCGNIDHIQPMIPPSNIRDPRYQKNQNYLVNETIRKMVKNRAAVQSSCLRCWHNGSPQPFMFDLALAIRHK